MYTDLHSFAFLLRNYNHILTTKLLFLSVICTYMNQGIKHNTDENDYSKLNTSTRVGICAMWVTLVGLFLFLSTRWRNSFVNLLTLMRYSNFSISFSFPSASNSDLKNMKFVTLYTSLFSFTLFRNNLLFSSRAYNFCCSISHNSWT